MSQVTSNQANLEELAYRDELTGLYNRRYLSTMLPEILETLGSRNEPGSLMLIDVDHFKQINDTLGHSAGDEAIRRVANILREHAGPNALVARYAGDEFIVVLPEMEQFFARITAEDLLKETIANRFFEEYGQMGKRLGLSIGLATFPQDAPAAEELIDVADKALYLAKSRGRGCVAVAGEQEDLPEAEGAIYSAIPSDELIGRADDLRALHAHLDTLLQDGTGGFVLVRGPDGVGKTRIAEAFQQVCLAWELPCVFAPCRETDLGQVYPPIVRVLERYLAVERKSPERLVRGLPEDQAREVIGLTPRMHHMVADGYREEVSEEERQRTLFRGLANTLKGLAREQAMVIILDEMQWVDAGSLALLNFLVEREGFPLLVVGTVQDDALRANDGMSRPLAELIDNVETTDHVMVRTLAPLTTPDVLRLCDILMPGRTRLEQFDSALALRSRGNPLMVEEILKLLFDRNAVVRVNEAWRVDESAAADIPGTLEEVLEARLAYLDQESRDLISCAAEAGNELGVEVLATLTGRREAELIEELDKLHRRGLIVARFTGGRNHITFSGGAVRKIYRQLTETGFAQAVHSQLAMLSLQAAQARWKGDEASYSDSALARLAFHFQKANDGENAPYFSDLARRRYKALLPDQSVSAEELAVAEPQPRPEPSAQALPQDALGYVVPMMQSLLDAIHAARAGTYAGRDPATRPEIVRPIRSMVSALEELFAYVDAVTISAREVAVRLNGVVLQVREYGDAPAEFGQILRRNGVAVLTIGYDAGVSDLAALAAAFAKDLPPVDDPQDWDAFLDEHSISSVGVVPAATMAKPHAPAAGTASPPASGAAGWRPGGDMPGVDDQDGRPTESRLQVQRLPTDSPLPEAGPVRAPTQTNLRSTASDPRSSSNVVHRAVNTPRPPVDANAVRPRVSSPVPAGQPAPRSSRFESTILPARNEDAPDDATLEDEADTAEPLAALTDGRSAPPDLTPFDLDGLPEGNGPFVLDEELAGYAASLVDYLIYNNERDAAAGVIWRVLAGYEGGNVHERLRVLHFLDALGELLESLSQDRVYRVLESFLCRVVEHEQSADLLSPIGTCAGRVMELFLRLGAHASVEHVGRVAADAGGALLQSAAERLNGSDFYDLLFSDLTSGDGARQQKAVQVLRPWAPHCRQRLIDLIRRADDYRLRRAAARVLADGVHDAGDELKRLLGPVTSIDEYTRVLEVLDSFPVDLQSCVMEGLHHPAQRVRHAAVSLARRLPPGEGDRLLRRAVFETPGDVAAAVLTAIGEANPSETTELVRQAVAERDDPPVLQAACTALGRMAPHLHGDSETVVRTIAGAVGGCMDRAEDEGVADAMLAAIWALTQFPDADVDVPLRAALEFPNERVKAYAQQVVDARGLPDPRRKKRTTTLRNAPSEPE